MRFVHAADIHLDSPLVGLERYAGAPVDLLRNATREAFENLVTLCLDEKVDLLLISGDLYDGDWRDYNTGLFFCKQMSLLREAGIPVYLVRGNHDAVSRITRELRLPDNVRQLTTDQAETIHLEDLGVAIHGQGFAQRDVFENLAVSFPVPVSGWVNIGLLHTALNGREGHDSYAPCTVADLRSRDYHYWALGHVHAREEVSRKPWIVFPGNLQGRHVRESGKKGCSLVTVTHGEITEVEHRNLDVLRWSRCELDTSGLPDPEALLDLARKRVGEELRGAGDRLVAMRFVIGGSCNFHSRLIQDPKRWTNELRGLATDLGQDSIWVEEVKIRTRVQAREEPSQEQQVLVEGLAEFFSAADQDPDLLADLCRQFDALRLKLPTELLSHDRGLDLQDPAVIRQMLPEAESLLRARLGQWEGR